MLTTENVKLLKSNYMGEPLINGSLLLHACSIKSVLLDTSKFPLDLIEHMFYYGLVGEVATWIIRKQLLI